MPYAIHSPRTARAGHWKGWSLCLTCSGEPIDLRSPGPRRCSSLQKASSRRRSPGPAKASHYRPAFSHPPCAQRVSAATVRHGSRRAMEVHRTRLRRAWPAATSPGLETATTSRSCCVHSVSKWQGKGRLQRAPGSTAQSPPLNTLQCDGTRPRCIRCRDNELPCQYDVPQGVSRAERMRLLKREGTSGRVIELERIVSSLRSGSDFQASNILARLRLGERVEDVANSLAAAPLVLSTPPRYA